MLLGLLVGAALVACAAPQAAQPTAVPPVTQQPPTIPPATEPTQAAPTAAALSPTALTSGATAVALTPAVAERVLALQEPRLQGDDVRAVQQRLLDLGYSQVGAVDGVFGPQTEAAVRAFQQANSLEVDGVVGPQTRARLMGLEATRAIVPILVHTSSTYLLGGVQAGAWLAAPAAAPFLLGGERYRVLVEGANETTAIGGRPQQVDMICPQTYTVLLEPAASGDAAVTVGGNWQLQPRAPRELAEMDPELQQATAAFLQAKGIAQPDVQITRAAQIDLDGDGSDEVMVTATRLTTQDPTDAAAGDYSFVAVQKTVDGRPTMVELAGNYFPQAGDFVAPYIYRVLGVLDLNGDGLLEVVVNGMYYEGASTSAFQVESRSARALLTTGCGV